jgi:rhodanese-related sulfurtransferase
MDIRTITPRQLYAIVESGEQIDLIDVRTPAEYREMHADVAVLMPLGSWDPKVLMAQRGRNPSSPLYTICRSGSRGKMACEKLAAAGCSNVINVDGGTAAWVEQGLPVVRGAKAVSLERQVRIAAGTLVLLGLLLAQLVHPYFALLTGFVGLGLVFAGITDTCGMAILLSRMPWNRLNKTRTDCCTHGSSQATPHAGS